MWIALGFVIALVLLWVAAVVIGAMRLVNRSRRQDELTEKIADWYVEGRAAGKSVPEIEESVYRNIPGTRQADLRLATSRHIANLNPSNPPTPVNFEWFLMRDVVFISLCMAQVFPKAELNSDSRIQTNQFSAMMRFGNALKKAVVRASARGIQPHPISVQLAEECVDITTLIQFGKRLSEVGTDSSSSVASKEG